MKKKKGLLFSTTRMIAFGFLAAILLGTFLLSLPIASKSGGAASFLDALFTATTSTCVTGLSTVVMAEQWSLFGQAVILILIQFGGLGIVTFTTIILLLLGKRISLKDRLLIQEAYNLDTLQGLVRLTLRILKGTLFVEFIGAAFYTIEFVPKYGAARGIWYSVFHAVSAFCNAGIDLLGSDSLVSYRGNVLINFVTMGLIILGGIGFPVWWDILQNIRGIYRSKKRKEHIKIQLRLHTRIVLWTTLTLILGGMALTFFMEYNNPDTLKNLPFKEKLLASCFQSVSLRTAGFATIPQQFFKEGTCLFYVVLMLIGGSPSGTAGGIKTVTMVLIAADILSTVRGYNETEVFQRKIAEHTVKKAYAVAGVSILMLLLLSAGLLAVQGGSFLDSIYEMTSAIATVGLSRNYTGTLNAAGRVIVIIGMYLGRIGPITMALAVNPKNRTKKVSYPAGKIFVG